MKKIVQRLQEPTPKFFRKLRNIGLALTAVGGVIATAPISLPSFLVSIGGYLAVAGGIASAVSQSAIHRDD
jgi:ABC-type xylose transport system permease subunit